jgi:hypothetical protein
MPQVWFKLMTPVFKWIKTFHASDSKVTVMRILVTIILGNYLSLCFQEFLFIFNFTCIKLLTTEVLHVLIQNKNNHVLPTYSEMMCRYCRRILIHSYNSTMLNCPWRVKRVTGMIKTLINFFFLCKQYCLMTNYSEMFNMCLIINQCVRTNFRN